MKFTQYFIVLLILANCKDHKDFKAAEYWDHINKAELAISHDNFKEALHHYQTAFPKIEKPFGKDVFNAALASQLIGDYPSRDAYLQMIINNSMELDYVFSVFVDQYMSEQEWESLVGRRTVAYDEELRQEFERMKEGDQLFRLLYDTQDDTINSIRKKNLQRITELTGSDGFPSQVELGYSSHYWNLPHHIVLYHTAQRRSYDKSVLDLEPLLRSAVEAGRFDPEKAILYLNFQNDLEKDHFEVYSSWQHRHPLLPDSLNNKVWYVKLDKEERLKANETRKKWFANTLEEIRIKAKYLKGSDLPFVFTSVRKSIGLLEDDLDQEAALHQYHLQTAYKIEHQ